MAQTLKHHISKHYKGFAVLLSLVVYTLFAALSAGYISCDENFQIVGFTALKLGFVSASDLPWELSWKLRQWIQPFFYWLTLSPLSYLGINNPFTLATVLRFVTGALSLISYYALFQATSKSLFPNFQDSKRAFWFFPIISFMPWLGVHPMSETASGAFLNLGIAAILTSDQRKTSLVRNVTIGMIAGLVFVTRFQSIFALTGLFLWLYFVNRSSLVRLTQMLQGFFVILILSTVIDYWGYGEWTFVPWTYFHVNLILGKAADFGVTPWWDYFKLLLVKVPGPTGLVLILGTLYFCVTRPKNILTWAAVPFIIGHSMVGHKELRFLFPIAAVCTLMTLVALFDTKASLSRKSQKMARLTNHITLFVVVTNFIALIVMASPVQPVLGVLKTILERSPQEATLVWVDNDPYRVCGNLDLKFYRPSKLMSQEAKDAELASSVLPPRPFYLYRREFGHPPPMELAGCQKLEAISTIKHLPVSWQQIDLVDKFYKRHTYHELFECR